MSIIHSEQQQCNNHKTTLFILCILSKVTVHLRVMSCNTEYEDMLEVDVITLGMSFRVLLVLTLNMGLSFLLASNTAFLNTMTASWNKSKEDNFNTVQPK